MIKSKELGVVFAENQDEATWFNVVENLKEDIKAMKNRIKRAEDDLKLDARKIEQKFKNGAKELIRQQKESIKVQEEFLELAKTKLKGKA